MSDVITIERPDASIVASEYSSLVDDANALIVDTVESHTAALEGYRYLKKAIKAIKDHYEPARKALDAAKKEILLARDKMTAPFEAAMYIVNDKVDVYEHEERRKAEEKARAEAEAERKRQEEARLAEAEAAEKAGDNTLAAEIIERPIEVITPATVAPETVAKVQGVSTRTVYRAEVVDFTALIKHAANVEGGDTYLLPHTANLNALARQLKEELSIPGVRVVTEIVRAVR